MTPSLTKSADKTWVVMGEIVTYSYDFYNDMDYDVWLTIIEDTRIGNITIYQEVEPHTHKIITREVIMNECRNITNVARAYCVDYQHHILISAWSNEISVFVFCPSLLTLTKSADKTEADLGEIVTYSYDFYNNCGYPVDLLFVEDNRIGQIEVYENIPSNTHRIITQQVIMNELGIITNNARAYYRNGIEQELYTDWSNEISVTVKSPSPPTLTKSSDKTRAVIGEAVTYSFDFYNDDENEVWLTVIEDSRIGIIEVYETIPPNTHRIITREVIMNEVGVITNTARASYLNWNEQQFYTNWSNEVSVYVNSLPKTLQGVLINTKAQSVNEMGAVAGLITFETVINTDLASETKLLKEVFA